MIGFLFGMCLVSLVCNVILFKAVHNLMKQVNRKFELRPGEYLNVIELKFGENIDISRADNDEPLDSITLVEFTNRPRNG